MFKEGKGSYVVVPLLGWCFTEPLLYQKGDEFNLEWAIAHNCFQNVFDSNYIRCHVDVFWWIGFEQSSLNSVLGGGFKYFLFHPYLEELLGDIIQLD